MKLKSEAKIDIGNREKGTSAKKCTLQGKGKPTKNNFMLYSEVESPYF